MSSAMVVGGGGFVGKALGEYLTRNTNAAVRLAARSVPSSKLGADYFLLPADYTALSETDFDRMLKDMDTVYFLAAATPRLLSLLDPAGKQKALNDNAQMPVALAKAAQRRGVKRFLFVSSCGVHGDQTHGKAFTETSPYVAHDAYVTSKIEAEQNLLANKDDVPPLTIVRPPMVYGPGFQGPARHLLNFAKRGLPLPLGRVTGNRRSMIGLQNLVHFLHHTGQSPEAANQVFLVTDDERPSTAEFVRLAGQAANRNALLLPFPQGLMNIAARALGAHSKMQRLFGDYDIDDSKARTLLNWRPPSTMLDELKRIFAEPSPNGRKTWQ
jgi:nucleoside-diphosphate-sugar epimerase